MSTPRAHLPVYVQFDIERYLSYGWKSALISEMIYRRHGYRLVRGCVKALRDGTDCPRKCSENCWIRRVARPEPDYRWVEELRKSAAPSTPFSTYYK